MRLRLLYILTGMLVVTSLFSCENKKVKISFGGAATYKGLYSFGPEIKSFKECASGHEFWVADSSAKLELQYSQLNMKPDEPVYAEVQGKKIKTVKDGMGSGYDSTLVVYKLIKITKDIPKNGCN